MLNYSTQYYTKQISVSEYLNHYRDAKRNSDIFANIREK